MSRENSIEDGRQRRCHGADECDDTWSWWWVMMMMMMMMMAPKPFIPPPYLAMDFKTEA